MSKIIFDIETTGLDPSAPDAKMHVMCYSTIENDGQELTGAIYDPSSAVELLNRYDEIIGHNIIQFDIYYLEVLTKLELTSKTFDTKTVSSMLFPTIAVIPGTRTQHSLAAWGMRLGTLKGDFHKDTNWSTLSQEMVDYCHQDVNVTKILYQHLSQRINDKIKDAVDMELSVARIIQKQSERGIEFDKPQAVKFLLELKEKEQEILNGLQLAFPPKYKAVKRKIAGRSYTKTDEQGRVFSYTKGAEYTDIKMAVFNPDSNDAIVDRLVDKYNWIPTEYTAPTSRHPGGKAKCSEAVLSQLTYKEAKKIIEISSIRKVIGYLSEGSEAWLKLTKNGRIHGQIMTTGVVTGRMSHRKPNMAQVPAAGTEMGKRCRELFIAPAGKVLVGCDASGLENRCLAHYLAPYDGGKYTQDIQSIDVHARSAAALECDRNTAKVFLYATLYGCGVGKAATILKVDYDTAGMLRDRFIASIDGFQPLLDKIKAACAKGFLVGLDGRTIPLPKAQDRRYKGAPFYQDHKGLNYLLQSAGAILMKRALLIASDSPLGTLEFVGNVHDEFIVEATEDRAEAIGKVLKIAIIKAGEYYNFRCPLDAEFKIGKTWADIH